MVITEMNDFEICRPVITGAEEFLRVARYAGQRVFGETPGGPLVPDEDHPGFPVMEGDEELARVRPTRTLGDPRFEVYNKLMLPVLQFAAPVGTNMNNLFYYTAMRLTAGTDRQRSGRGPVLPVPAYHLAVQRGLAYDVMPVSSPGDDSEDGDKNELQQQPIILHCDAITLSRPPHKSEVELVLIPDIADEVTGLFVEEHEIFMDTLRRLSRLKDRAVLGHRYTPLIPFAVLRNRATEAERRQFNQQLQAELPVRLEIGSLLPPMVR